MLFEMDGDFTSTMEQLLFKYQTLVFIGFGVFVFFSGLNNLKQFRDEPEPGRDSVETIGEYRQKELISIESVIHLVVGSAAIYKLEGNHFSSDDDHFNSNALWLSIMLSTSMSYVGLSVRDHVKYGHTVFDSYPENYRRVYRSVLSMVLVFGLAEKSNNQVRYLWILIAELFDLLWQVRRLYHNHLNGSSRLKIRLIGGIGLVSQLARMFIYVYVTCLLMQPRHDLDSSVIWFVPPAGVGVLTVTNVYAVYVHGRDLVVGQPIKCSP